MAWTKDSRLEKGAFVGIGVLIGVLISSMVSSSGPTQAAQHANGHQAVLITDRSTLTAQAGAATRVRSLPKQGTLPYTDCKSIIEPIFGYQKENLTNPQASIIVRQLADDMKTFECVGREAGTVKTVEHNYEYVYGKWLGRIRLEPLKVLAIGLGCNMAYGPGHSFELWKRYLPNAAISFIELDGACAEPFRPKLEATGGKLYVGSQSDPKIMAQIVAESKAFGGFDLVTDAGSILPDVTQQSLEGMWTAVKPGGIYSMEDIWRHFDPEYHNRTDTVLPKLTHLMHMIHCRTVWRLGFKRFDPVWDAKCQQSTEFERQVLAIECIWEGCLLVKHVW